MKIYQSDKFPSFLRFSFLPYSKKMWSSRRRRKLSFSASSGIFRRCFVVERERLLSSEAEALTKNELKRHPERHSKSNQEREDGEGVSECEKFIQTNKTKKQKKDFSDFQIFQSEFSNSKQSRKKMLKVIKVYGFLLESICKPAASILLKQKQFLQSFRPTSTLIPDTFDSDDFHSTLVIVI